MSTIVNRDNLNDAIDFDVPFTLDLRDDTGRVTLSRADGVYGPTVEHDAVHDVLIDGHAVNCPCGYCAWSPLTGYTRQHGYRGAVMHASEFVGGGLADDLLATADEHPVYMVTSVEVTECDEDCDPGEHTPEDVEAGIWGHEPAGWCILRLRP